AGPIPNNGTAATFAGTSTVTGNPPRTTTTSNSVASSLGTVRPLSAFTLEGWVRTTSAAGGIVVSDSLYEPTTPDGSESPVVDRVLYLGSDGKVSFGTISDNVKQAITSPAAVNDGSWHHLAASMGADGAKLFVDGSQVAAGPGIKSNYVTFGHWRLGGDRLTGWTPAPTSGYLAGSIANVAVYPTALTGARIAAHAAAAGTTPPPGNAAPTASFTASCAELVCSFNAAGSNDSDGTITGYAWDFGDGTTGTGATASRTYAAGGTYTVRLTVTDDDSDTGTTTRTVSPAATPPANSPFATDGFDRTVSNGWGSADLGGAWTASPSSAFSVGSGAGRVSIPAGATQRATLNSTSSTSTDLTSTFALDKLGVGGGAYLTFTGRRVATNQQYETQVTISTSGAVTVSLVKLNGSSTATTLGAATRITGLTYAAGSNLNIRHQVEGTSPTTLRVKVWAAGTSEPSAWAVTATDSSAGIQAAGGVGVKGYVSGSATNAPLVWSVLSLEARPVN
ncbi:MAG: PKD domain-containing protein, partial [Propionibacteriaceae bacterium]